MTSPTTIHIDLPGHRITGTLNSTPIAESLVALLPLTLHFEDYGQQEKIATLPIELDTTNAPRGSNAPAATIAYYKPAQALVLYYDDVGHFAGIVPVGTLDDISSLRTTSSAFTATIRRAD